MKRKIGIAQRNRYATVTVKLNLYDSYSQSGSGGMAASLTSVVKVEFIYVE